jgi:HK97 family phage portal protein
MGIAKSIGAGVGWVMKSLGAASFPSQGYLPTLGSTPSATGLLISQGTAMCVGAVYACVTIRSQDMARCTPRIYRPNKDGSREIVTDHPMTKLIKRPNRQQTWFEFMEQMNAAYLLRGNAYAAKIRNSRGQITELIPINPDAVLVMESVNGEIFYNVNRIGLWQIAMLRDFPPTMAQEDILHLRGLTFNALVAISTIGMARDAIGVAMGLEQQAARWMANGSRPSIVLESSKTVSEAAAKRLKQQWDELKAGLQNTGNTVVLEEGMKATALQLTSSDLAFIEQRNFQLGDVMRFYRMPPFKLGLEQLRGVNLVQVNQEYVNDTIAPDLDRWEQKLEYELGLTDEGLELGLDESRLLRTDILTRYDIGRMGTLSGLISTNEFRAGERLPPVPGGDEVRAPVNLAALGSDATGTAPDGAGRPSGQNVAGPVAEPGAHEDDEEKALAIVQGMLKKVRARRRGEDADTNLIAALAGETVGLDHPVN